MVAVVDGTANAKQTRWNLLKERYRLCYYVGCAIIAAILG